MRSTPLIVMLLLAVAAGPTAATAKDDTANSAAASDAPGKYPLAEQGPEPRPIDPPTREAIQASINRGVDFLLDDQRPDGGWGSPENTKGLNIYAPVPGAHDGFKLAVAGLVVQALCECEDTLDADRRQRVDDALERGAEWMLANHEKVRRSAADAIYNTWGHAYGISGFVALHQRAAGDPDLQARLKQAAQFQADQLKRYAYLSGGWGYYDFDHVAKIPGSSPNSFTTATGMISLHDAEAIGVTFPEKLMDKAAASVIRQRNPDFSYAYGEYLMYSPRLGINRPAGSLGRSQACNAALRMWGDDVISDNVLRAWLKRLFARNGWLGIGRKRPVPHESYFQVAGYFYYYGHYYAAMCIDMLPEDERPYYQDHLASILLPLQEKDGSWWDYPFYNYHQQYGAAMSLYCLRHCLHGEPVSPGDDEAVAQAAL